MARTWFITGVNSGFGLEMTKQLLANGERVAGTVRKLDSMKELQSQYPENLVIFPLDLTDSAEIYTVVDQAFNALGKIDVVVNNAGYGLFGALESLTPGQLIHQVNTNLMGSIHVARAAVPHLREQGSGHILQLSSYGGQATHPGASAYHASKWGIEGFMESLASELAAFNIKVTIVEPGGARTGFRSAAGHHLNEPIAAYNGTPAGMVNAVLNDPERVPSGDPVKMVNAMIVAVTQPDAMRRLVLGSDSYKAVHQALTQRLAELEQQACSASATDF
ncbi:MULTISPECIES: SDR family oxidoreductase [Gammaproteobacteria]|uniref:SDR family oxidoreductase n=1 Tax=Gammaproteobacteria TaxID=1236 RepID=UPI003A8F1E15